MGKRRERIVPIAAPGAETLIPARTLGGPVPDLLVSRALRPLLDDAALRGVDHAWFEETAPVPPGPAAAIVDLPPRRWGEAEFAAAKGLKVLAYSSAGVDRVDVEAAKKRGILVTNTPGVLAEAVADLTWGLILAAARGITTHERTVREGRWTRFSITDFLGLELRGATLGVVGAGGIGQAVARRAPAFGMRVLYSTRTPRPVLEAQGARRVGLDDLLRQSDVVTVHVPLTEETRGMMDAARFARMRQGSVFVNMARGDVVDEAALAHALTSGHLLGAGIDVFQGEPKLGAALARAPNLVVTPHMASATYATRSAMARLAVQNARAVLAGKPPLNPV